MEAFPVEIHHLVVATGRVSTAAFVLALIGAAWRYRAVALWWGFLAVHTVHYAAVTWFAIVNEGRDLFPGGRSFDDAGGWPTVLGSVTLFYGLAWAALAERRAGASAGRWLRIASPVSTALIGVMFLAVYVPLVGSLTTFAVPVVAIAGALGAYLVAAFRRNQRSAL